MILDKLSNSNLLTDEDRGQLQWILTWALEAFIGTIMALSWTSVIDLILGLIAENFPGLAIAWAISYAWWVTVLSVFGLFFWNKIITKMLKVKGEEEVEAEPVKQEEKKEVKEKKGKKSDEDFE